MCLRQASQTDGDRVIDTAGTPEISKQHSRHDDGNCALCANNLTAQLFRRNKSSTRQVYPKIKVFAEQCSLLQSSQGLSLSVAEPLHRTPLSYLALYLWKPCPPGHPGRCDAKRDSFKETQNDRKKSHRAKSKKQIAVQPVLL